MRFHPRQKNYSFDYYNCVHGMGHGLMVVTGDQLFESLQNCDNLDGQWEKNSCYSGVFNVASYDFKKVFGLCAGVEKDFTTTCYQSLGRDASGGTLSNVEKTRAVCALGKDFEQRSNCIIGAVKDFISYLHSNKRA